MWLTKVDPVHVGQWVTFIRTRNVSATSASVDLTVTIENNSTSDQDIKLITELYYLDDRSERKPTSKVSFPETSTSVLAGNKQIVETSLTIKDPLLWGPPPLQKPNLYVAVTKLYSGGKLVDEYETQFGIRSVKFDAANGVLVNGKPIRVQGVNQHHDLGALGAAFNIRAAQRQLEILAEMGCNAIRMAHNPPAPELLDLTDRMGFLVIDEVFDCWFESGSMPYAQVHYPFTTTEEEF